MIILGIIDSKPSAATILRDGQIMAAVAEERLCRLKMADGLPLGAIAEVMRLAAIRPDDIDGVAVAQEAKHFYPEPMPWSGWFDEDSKKDGKRRFDNLGATLAPLVGSWSLAWRAHHLGKRLLTQKRRTALPNALLDRLRIKAPVTFFDHHYCHATSAYFTSGYYEALVITLDGGGDGRSGAVYTGQAGQLEALSSVDSYNSLGNFYSYITELCGFRAEKHEGKITGLAALGQPSYLPILRRFIRYEEPGQIRYTVPMYQRSALQKLKAALPPNFKVADLAASVQELLEEVGVAFVRYWLRQTGLRSLAVAGGVFANVKFNQKVHHLAEVDKLFVHPAMDDSGLAVGAALALSARRRQQPQALINRLPHVYLGSSYSQDEVAKAVLATGLQAEFKENIQEAIATRLAAGHVVARFHGAMEYGPRALGNRSILYQTTDPSVNDWLNKRLQRTEFMPFAPATLKAEARKCFLNLEGAEDSARFMTITFECTQTMARQSPGVVHVDNTARPQLVDAATSPDLHAILSAYFALTGIPSLINTSFNMHGEPIVCSPEDALRSFQAGRLDYLALGNWLLPHPKGCHKGLERGASATG